MNEYRRSYGTQAEFDFRLEVFTRNFNAILNHNMFKRNTHTYKLGLTKFADWTEEEF